MLPDTMLAVSLANEIALLLESGVAAKFGKRPIQHPHVAFRLFDAPLFDGVIPNRGHVLKRFGKENISSHIVWTFGRQ